MDCKYKLSLILLFIVFSCPLFCQEHDICAFLRKDHNLEVIDTQETIKKRYSQKKLQEIYKKASDENRFLLDYQKDSFKNVFMEEDKDYSPLFNKVGPGWRRLTRKDEHDILVSENAESVELFDRGKYYYVVQFSAYGPRLMVSSIGIYTVEVYFNNFVYTFSFQDPKSLLDDGENEKIFAGLNDYIEVREVEGGSDFDSTGLIKTYCWKSSSDRSRYYNDLCNKNESLPQYVIDFQNDFEEVLSLITDFFDNEPLPQKVTAANLNIRDYPKGNKILKTVQKGTVVTVLEIGKPDIIDEIDGNWVKVEISSGAKEKNGNVITEAFTGWCFDGYLE